MAERYNHPSDPPPFKTGDLVVPTIPHTGWTRREPREIRQVSYEERGFNYGRWRYHIANPLSPFGVSKYNPVNFERYGVVAVGHHSQGLSYYEKVSQIMGEKPVARYEKTKQFAMRAPEEGMMPVVTPLRDFRNEVLADVKEIIVPGEQWLIVQTLSLVELDDPKPPLRTVKEYK